MKRMLKKLFSIALAGAMVLSLSVTALAADEERDHLVGSDGATTSNVAQGSEDGEITNQGPIPDPVIKVKLPTTASGVFDVYIDPHNLIQESGAAMFEEEISVFEADTLVYFKNNGDSPSYSKTSDDITIVNKSSVPVSVEMEAKWTKGTNATYLLAKDADDLAALKADGQAALYLYLKDSKDNQAPVVEKDKATPSVTFSTVKDATNSDATTDVAGQYLSKYIKSVKFAFLPAADPQDIQLINEGTTGKTPADWDFTFTKSDKKTPTVVMDATKLPNYTTISGTTRKTDNAYKTANAANISITATQQLDGSYVYTVPDGKAESVVKIQKGTTDIATITIEWDYEAIAANGYDIQEVCNSTTETGKKTTYKMKLTGVSGEGAKITTDLNCTEGAYTLQKNASTGKLAWTLGDSFTEDSSFHSLSFNLTGAITDGDVCSKAWDTAFPSTVTGSKLGVTWKVYACEAVDPSATVTSALTSATGTAELTVDWGYGSAKTNTITAASYLLNGTATPLSVDSNVAISGTTVTITSPNAGLFEGANGVITLTFSNPDTGYSKDVTVDLLTAAS